MGAKERLREFFREHPNACMEGFTYQQIGDAIGVSRQRVHQIMPEYQRANVCAIRLQQFLDQEPSAILSKAAGGMTYRQIADKVGLSVDQVESAWKALELPPRTLLVESLTPSERSKRSYHRRAKNEPGFLAKRLAYTVAWRARNPEKAREMQRRANATQNAKRRAARAAANT